MEDRAREVDGDVDAGAASGGLVESDLARELERARDRIAFYESFDRLIQENIARSGDLLREAAEQRAAAAREVAAARAELDRRLDEQRSTLASVAEDLLALQEQVGALSHRVAAAQIALGAVPGASPQGSAELSSEREPDERAATAEAAPPGDEDGSVPLTGNAAEAHGAGEPAADEAPSATVGAAAGSDRDAEAVTQPAAPPMSVVVHGVPRAADALSLQRHLAGLGHVEAVEAREYIAGVLRLQVLACGPLTLDDLRRWEGGAELEPVHVLADVIEVKLPGAAGF